MFDGTLSKRVEHPQGKISLSKMDCHSLLFILLERRRKEAYMTFSFCLHKIKHSYLWVHIEREGKAKNLEL